MNDFILMTTNSFGRLAPTLLTLILCIYLFSLRDKSDKAMYLGGYFLCATFYNLGYLYSYSTYHPTGALGIYMGAAVVFGYIFKVQFAYHVPDGAWPREARIVFWLTVVVSIFSYLDYFIRHTLLDLTYYVETHFYGSSYVSSFLPVFSLIFIVWATVVFLRQALRTDIRARGDRTALHFLFLSLWELSIAVVYVLQRFDISFSDQATTLIINGSILILFFAYALLYLNVASEPSSFIVKLVGISLVTVMTLISSLGLYNLSEEEGHYDVERLQDLKVAQALLKNENIEDIPANVLYLSVYDHPPSVKKPMAGSAKVLYRHPQNYPGDDYFKAARRYQRIARPGAGRATEGLEIRQYYIFNYQPTVYFRMLKDGKVYEAGFSYLGYRRFMHTRALFYFGIVLLSTLIMLLVFPLFFRATVTRPLKDLLGLLKAAEENPDTTAGALSPADSPTGSFTDSFTGNEITRLSQSFNNMLGLLKGAKEKFSDYSEHLEEVEKIVESHATDSTLIKELGGKTLVCASPVMRGVLQAATRFAGFKKPALVTGETGTGKEVVARLIHHESERGAYPFVAVNCAAIPLSLWEDEIFGHLKGAFTDARSSRPGRVSEAEKGSLFFDEIGEMPLDMQAKMLRLLQEKQYQPIGGDSPKPADCRFIFATNRNLEKMVENGEFREDLYYRINVFHVPIPPLRERPRDIPVLARHIIAHISQESEMPALEIDNSAMAALLSYNWPGNIRELENVLARAMATEAAQTTQTLSLSELPPAVAEQAKKLVGSAAPRLKRDHDGELVFGGESFDQILKKYSRRLIESALKESRGNKTKAAELLGMKRNRLRYQIKELGIAENGWNDR